MGGGGGGGCKCLNVYFYAFLGGFRTQKIILNSFRCKKQRVGSILFLINCTFLYLVMWWWPHQHLSTLSFGRQRPKLLVQCVGRQKPELLVPFVHFQFWAPEAGTPGTICPLSVLSATGRNSWYNLTTFSFGRQRPKILVPFVNF